MLQNIISDYPLIRDQTNVDYEPWHWRYEGSIEALKIFESSNRKTI